MSETGEQKKTGNARRAVRICENMTYSGAEAFRRLRTNIMIALGDDREGTHRVIGVTSAQVAEGKSTVSVNLAYCLAEQGKKVLLIDGDMRRPTVHSLMNVPQSPGLSEILSGQESLKNVDFCHEGGGVSFRLIPAGCLPENPSELLDSDRFRKLLSSASRSFDYVIVDLPPVNAVVDAVSVSACTDGMLVVLREGHCPRGAIRECVSQLRYAGANILGFVMNGCTRSAKRYGYY